MLTALKQKFLEFGAVFGPCKVFIDESMVPYFGRHPTKQIIRGKPIRWGYNAWVAASRSGFDFQLDMYQGKETSGNEIYEKEFGLGGRVISNFFDTLELAYPQHKFSLYFENFFPSQKLLDVIRQRGHGATGTMRSNSLGNCPIADPKQFKKEARGAEKHFCDKSSETLVVQWNENSVVFIDSNQRGMLLFIQQQKRNKI